MTEKNKKTLELMKKYRIVKKTKGNKTQYFPQVKFLFWWYNPFKCEHYSDVGFSSLEYAQEELCDFVRRTEVEIIEFDPNKDCKK